MSPVATTRDTALEGRVAVVTGGTSGIGREIVLGLSSLGATVVLVGRGADRTARAAEEIARATGNARVEPLPVSDLALKAEMLRVADETLHRHPVIHLLVNNAGAYFTRREVTADGLERTFALNVLAPFVLTSLLAPALKAGAPSRVVEVASAAHRGNTVDLDDLQSTAKYAGFEAYGRSKLELILLTREFARRLRGTEVTVNAVHPGFVRSGFAQNNGGGVAATIGVLGFLFGRSVRRGAATPLFAATDPSIASVTGEYFSGRRVAGDSPQSRDTAAARRLFSLCSGLAGIPELPEPIEQVPVAGLPGAFRSSSAS